MHYLSLRTARLGGADFTMADDREYAYEETRTIAAIHHNVLYESLNRCFEAMADYLKKSRFTIINCTPQRRLTAFPHMSLDSMITKVLRRVRQAGQHEGLVLMTTEGGAEHFFYIPVWATTQQPSGSARPI